MDVAQKMSHQSLLKSFNAYFFSIIAGVSLVYPVYGQEDAKIAVSGQNSVDAAQAGSGVENASDITDAILANEQSLDNASAIDETSLGSIVLAKSQLEAKRARIIDSVAIDAGVRQRVSETYSTAIACLTETLLLADRIKTLQEEQAVAPTLLKKQEATLTDLLENSKVELEANTSELSLAQMRQQTREVEAQAADLRIKLSNYEMEIDRRSKKLRDLPTQISEANEEVEQESTSLTDIAVDEANVVDTASYELSKAQLLLHRQKLALLQTETIVFDVTGRLLNIKRDIAEQKLIATQNQLQALQTLLSQTEQRIAQQQSAEVKGSVESVPAAIEPTARYNLELAQKNQLIVKDLDALRRDLSALREQTIARESEYRILRDQAEATQYRQSLGIMLQSERAALPDLSATRKYIARNSKRLSQLQVDLLDWEHSRRQLLDEKTSLNLELRNLNIATDSALASSIEKPLSELLRKRYSLLEDLTDNGRTTSTRIASLKAAQVEFIALVQGQDNFISQHILWVPSTSIVNQGTLGRLPIAISRLADRKDWRTALSGLRIDMQESPLSYIVAGCLWTWLLVRNRSYLRLIQKHGQAAKRATCTLIGPTLKTILYSSLLASIGPAFVTFFGWRFYQSPEVGKFGQAFGAALLQTGGVWFAIEWFRQAFRDEGLAENHFQWDASVLHALRLTLSGLELIVLPLLLIVSWTEWLNDEFAIESVGRLSFVAAMTITSIMVIRFFGRGSELTDFVESNPKLTWLAKFNRGLPIFFAMIPVIFVIASLAGYHFAAVHLAIRFFICFNVAVIVLLVRAFLLRWLLIGYRRLAMKRARERLSTKATITDKEIDSEGDASNLIEATSAVQMTDINMQTRNIIRAFVILLAAVMLYWTWKEFLPALNGIFEYKLWIDSIKTSRNNGIAVPVTIYDLLLAVATLVTTVISYRNLPGLLDIAVLQRLPFDAGSRYAASSLLRYILAIVGTVLAFFLVGVSWSSIQWLIAAISVGLGFGLQEIFANFVSGIILLFERPIRVGDTVTIGEVTGTVTRIRIRATTVLDWDNKELIVPNREFVTGNLVNWTLANSNLRLVLKVGVAYGSDTRLATKLLYQIAKENTQILKEPEPVVVFRSFGDSTLDFELRFFVVGLIAYRRIAHEINTTIDETFREHQIEIAFPQRDLHLRTVSSEARQALMLQTQAL